MSETTQQTDEPVMTPAMEKLAGIADLMEPQRRSELLEKIQGETTEPTKEETKEEPKKEPEAPEEPKAETNTEPADPQNPTKDELLAIEHELLGKQTFGGQQKNEFEKPDDVMDFVSKQLGLDEFDKFASVTSKWRKDSETLSTVQQEFEQVTNTLNGLPEQLQSAIAAHINGEDWRSPIDSYAALDYDKKVTDYGQKELIDGMMPGKFTESDWANYRADDPDGEHRQLRARIDDAYDVAKRDFKNNKTAIKEQRAKIDENRQARERAYNSSIERSVEVFGRSFPDAGEGVIDNLKKVFSDGRVDQLFYNQDGSLKEDALVKLAMAESGFDLIKQFQAAAEKQALTKQRLQEIEDRKGGVKTTGGPGSAGAPKAEATPEDKAKQELLRRVGGLGPMQPTYT